MKKRILYIILTLVVSTFLVIGLFLSSEHIMKKENPFIRRFIPHHIHDVKYIDLEVNSYYIAGVTKDSIYLGNYTAPLLITAVPLDFSTKVEHIIRLDETQRTFRSIKIHILNDTFYVSDGSIHMIFNGEISYWYDNQFLNDNIYVYIFTLVTIIHLIFRS